MWTFLTINIRMNSWVVSKKLCGHTDFDHQYLISSSLSSSGCLKKFPPGVPEMWRSETDWRVKTDYFISDASETREPDDVERPWSELWLIYSMNHMTVAAALTIIFLSEWAVKGLKAEGSSFNLQGSNLRVSDFCLFLPAPSVSLFRICQATCKRHKQTSLFHYCRCIIYLKLVLFFYQFAKSKKKPQNGILNKWCSCSKLELNSRNHPQCTCICHYFNF